MKWKAPQSTLDYELAEEQAGTLGRLGANLERALAALRVAGYQDPARRSELVTLAGDALWHFLIQREALGLRDEKAVLRAYLVPASVFARMGIMPKQASRLHRAS